MFCLIVGGNSGTSKLEINFNGNLNKLKESGGDLLAVRDELVSVADVTFWIVDDDDLEAEDDDLDTEDGVFGTEDCFDPVDGEFMTEDCDFETVAGDFGAVEDDFVTDNVGTLKTQFDVDSDSGWGNGLDEIHRYFLGCVMDCITCK